MGLYFEAHVTLEPTTDRVRIEALRQIASVEGFRLADFLQQDSNPAAAAKMFTSARSDRYVDLYERMGRLIISLRHFRFKVLRYKIEDTIVDSNREDEYGLLHEQAPSQGKEIFPIP